MPNLPGNIKAASHADTQMDIKMALLMVQSFIRLYAIREKLESNNSIERAEKLHKMGVISASTLQEFSEPFDFLTYLRIKNQAYSISRHDAPGNTLRLGQLSHIEALTLKKIQHNFFRNNIKGKSPLLKINNTIYHLTFRT